MSDWAERAIDLSAVLFCGLLLLMLAGFVFFGLYWAVRLTFFVSTCPS